MTRLTSSVRSQIRFSNKLGALIRTNLMRNAWISALLLLAIVASGCAYHVPGSPEAIVDGALRSSAQSVVAPPEYRKGVIAQSLADAWIQRVESDYRQWYASPMLDQEITGIHNVVAALVAQPGPIATSVDVSSIDVPSASVNGDEATFEDATIEYVTHYASGTWTQLDVPGVTMCIYTLHRTESGWRVTDGSCNVSGG